MKTTIKACSLVLLLALTACSKGEDSGSGNSEENTGRTIDSSTVGRDSEMVDTRRDIDMSDEEKQALPGRKKDSTASDEDNKK